MYCSRRMFQPAALKKTVFYFPLIIIAVCFESFGYFPDSSFLPFADSLFDLQTDTQVTALRKKRVIQPKTLQIRKKKRTYFMVTTCKTIQQPFSTIVNTVRNTTSYPTFFNFISKAVDIEEGKSDDPVTMFTGVYGLYRIYFFGKIREEYSADSTRYRVFCGNVEQKDYRKAWRRRVKGLIKIGSHDVDIFWTVEKRSESSCRVSLTASQSFTTKIPNWMVSIGTNKIFRGMVKDLEKYLAKTNSPAPSAAPEAAPPPAPETPPEVSPTPKDATETTASETEPAAAPDDASESVPDAPPEAPAPGENAPE